MYLHILCGSAQRQVHSAALRLCGYPGNGRSRGGGERVSEKGPVTVPHKYIFLCMYEQEYANRKWGSGSHTPPTPVSFEQYSIVSALKCLVLPLTAVPNLPMPAFHHL